MGRSSRQEINKEVLAVEQHIDQMDLIDMYRTFHPRTEHSSQMHMNHSPE